MHACARAKSEGGKKTHQLQAEERRKGDVWAALSVLEGNMGKWFLSCFSVCILCDSLQSLRQQAGPAGWLFGSTQSLISPTYFFPLSVYLYMFTAVYNHPCSSSTNTLFIYIFLHFWAHKSPNLSIICPLLFSECTTCEFSFYWLKTLQHDCPLMISKRASLLQWAGVLSLSTPTPPSCFAFMQKMNCEFLRAANSQQTSLCSKTNPRRADAWGAQRPPSTSRSVIPRTTCEHYSPLICCWTGNHAGHNASSAFCNLPAWKTLSSSLFLQRLPRVHSNSRTHTPLTNLIKGPYTRPQR